MVQENFELLSVIWGGLPATTSLPFGIDGDKLGTNTADFDENLHEGEFTYKYWWEPLQNSLIKSVTQ